MIKKYRYFILICVFIPLHASQQKSSLLNDILIKATDKNSLPRVKEMLGKGADINYRRPSDGATALVIAAKNNNEKLALELLKRGANPNIPAYMYVDNPERITRPQRGIYPLHLAALHNNARLINQLIAHKAYLDVETEQLYQVRNVRGPHTPADLACIHEEFEALKTLIPDNTATPENLIRALHSENLRCIAYVLEHEADPNLINSRGMPLLSSAIVQSDVCVAWLLLKYKADLHIKKEHPDERVRLALKTANPSMLNHMIYTNPCYGHDREGYTPLHCAVLMGLSHVVQPLLQQGADPHARGIFDITPLHLALTFEHILSITYEPRVQHLNEKRTIQEIVDQKEPIITSLLIHGADPTAEAFDASSIHCSAIHTGMNYLTPLLLALQQGDIDLFYKMLSYCTCFNERNISHINHALKFFQNLSPKNKLVDILKKLHGKGSSMHMCTDGQYCLHLAVQAGDPASVDWLIRSGANYNQENLDGLTPIEVARSKKCNGDILRIFASIRAEKITREIERSSCNELTTQDGITEVYDMYIGNLERLSEFLAYFKNIPGTDENIRLVQQFGTKENLDRYKGIGKGKARGNAKGALFELEAAYALILDGKQIKRLRVIYDTTEFDIETTSGELVECKSIYWPHHKYKHDKALKAQLIREQRVAKKHGKKFIFYSKNAIPEPWKEWMKSKNIIFKENIAAPSKAQTERYAPAVNRRQDRIPCAAASHSAH